MRRWSERKIGFGGQTLKCWRSAGLGPSYCPVRRVGSLSINRRQQFNDILISLLSNYWLTMLSGIPQCLMALMPPGKSCCRENKYTIHLQNGEILLQGKHARLHLLPPLSSLQWHQGNQLSLEWCFHEILNSIQDQDHIHFRVARLISRRARKSHRKVTPCTDVPCMHAHRRSNKIPTIHYNTKFTRSTILKYIHIFLCMYMAGEFAHINFFSRREDLLHTEREICCSLTIQESWRENF